MSPGFRRYSAPMSFTTAYVRNLFLPHPLGHEQANDCSADMDATVVTRIFVQGGQIVGKATCAVRHVFQAE